MERHGDLTSSEGPFGAARDNTKTSGTPEDVEQLKTEIHQTQAELQQTVAEIQERLSPTHLKEQAASTVREATIGRVHHMINRAEDSVTQAAESTRHAANMASREIRNNPMPYALIGVGIAWLFANHRQSDYRYDTSREWSDRNVGSAMGTSQEAAWGGSATGYESSSSVSGSSPSYGTSASFGSSTSFGSESYVPSESYASSPSRRSRMERVRSRWEDMLEDNPVALGIAALAAGALLGAAIPTTHVENEYLGEARDSVVESAKAVAENTVQKVVEKT